MQFALAVVLLATLGLAWLLAGARERASTVEFADKPHLADPLKIRYPRGWQVEQEPIEGLPTIITFTEPMRSRRAMPRTLTVYETPSDNKSAEQMLRSFLSDKPGELEGSVGPITFLDNPGVILRYVLEAPVPNDPLGRSIEVPGWFAAAVVPHGSPDGRDLGVVVGLTGDGAMGPAGRRFVERVTGGLTCRQSSNSPASATQP
jgi:hypothetical protein